MSLAEDELELVTNQLMIVIDANRKTITGVNGISDITLDKDFESEDTDSRISSIEMTLDILEER
jgi:hypothetical protein